MTDLSGQYSFYALTDFACLPTAAVRSEADHQALLELCSCNLAELCDKHPGILLYPDSIGRAADKLGEERLLSFEPGKGFCCADVVGFISWKQLRLHIRSRFAPADADDFFLHYLLQRIMGLNLFKLPTGSSKAPLLDFRLYLFPLFLQQALRQGLYKRYERYACNDCRMRGVLDVARQLKLNQPFAGRIATQVREYSFDNEMTELIRHTVEFIAARGREQLLQADADIQDAVRQIREATPAYNVKNRQKVMAANLRGLTNPYFAAYLPLQVLCLQILRQEALSYANAADPAAGLLLRASYLWEEFLDCALLHKAGFTHPQNRSHRQPLSLFADGSYARFPDFWQEGCVLDAKYKRLQPANISREDLYQLIAYMHILKAGHGGLIFPYREDGNRVCFERELNGWGGLIKLFALPVVQQGQSFADYCQRMDHNVSELGEQIKAFCAK